VPDGNPVGVEPDNSTEYRFVAYSYYGDKGVDPVGTGITPSQDLVWGACETTIEDTEAGRMVPITMTHRFSRVKVSINAGAIATAIVTIGDVKIVGGKTANLTDIKLGTVEPTGTDVAYDITSSLTGSGAVKATPNYQLFYPSPTAVTIGSIELTITSSGTNKTFSTLMAKFTQPLEAGKSYTLEVDLKGIEWAKSNIYWNGSRLVFSNTGNSSYQGVHFKYGSLIGISPIGGVEADLSDMGDVIIYVPNVSNGTWTTRTIGSAANSWGQDHPSIPASILSSSDQYSNPDFINYRGDICSYLTGKTDVPAGNWRMPTSAEFGAKADYSSLTFTAASDPNNATGRGSMGSAGVTYNTGSGAVFFPVTGFRSTSNGCTSPEYIGKEGYYWSGSVRGGIKDLGGGEGYSLIFNNTNYLVSQNTDFGDSGFAVRCIKYPSPLPLPSPKNISYLRPQIPSKNDKRNRFGSLGRRRGERDALPGGVGGGADGVCGGASGHVGGECGRVFVDRASGGLGGASAADG
jgi:hypothetical protein